MWNFLGPLTYKYRALVAIAVVLLLVIILALVLIAPRDKKITPQPSPSPEDSLRPQTRAENKEQSFRIDYSPGSKTYWIHIEASTVDEYINKRRLAVEELKKLNVDPCDFNITFWAIPFDIKKKFTKQDLLTIRDITCPK